MAKNWDGMMAIVQKSLQMNIIELHHADVGHDVGILMNDNAPAKFAWLIHPRGSYIAALTKWEDLKFLLCLGESHANLSDSHWFLFEHMNLVEYNFADLMVASSRLMAELIPKQSATIEQCANQVDNKNPVQRENTKKENIVSCTFCGKELYCNFPYSLAGHKCEGCASKGN